jgi:hypothetical protein
MLAPTSALKRKKEKVSLGRTISARDVGSKQSGSELPVAGSLNSLPGAPQSLLLVGSHCAEVPSWARLIEVSRERSLLHDKRSNVNLKTQREKTEK